MKDKNKINELTIEDAAKSPLGDLGVNKKKKAGGRLHVILSKPYGMSKAEIPDSKAYRD